MIGGMKGALDLMGQFSRIPAPVKVSLAVLCELAGAAELLGPPSPGGAQLTHQVATETGTPAALLAAFYTVIHQDAVAQLATDGGCKARMAAMVMERVRGDGAALAAAAAAEGWPAAVMARVAALQPNRDALQLRELAGRVAQTYALFLARQAPAPYLQGLAKTFHG